MVNSLVDWLIGPTDSLTGSTVGSTVEPLKYLSGADATNEQLDPYRSADFTEEVGGSLGEAARTDAGLFRDVLLDSPGARNTKISHLLEASSMAKVLLSDTGSANFRRTYRRRRQKSRN
jgi:hypothetical protein